MVGRTNSAITDIASDSDSDDVLVTDLVAVDVQDPFHKDPRLFPPCKIDDHGKKTVNCRKNPQCYAQLVRVSGQSTKGVWSEEKKLAQAIGLGAHPEEQEKIQEIPVGIQNLGATCYMNSLLQAWYMNPLIRDAVFRWRATSENKEAQVDMCTALQKLFAMMQDGELLSCSEEASELAKSLSLDTTVQQDSEEFSKLFLDLLRECLLTQKSPALSQFVDDHLSGKIQPYLKCTSCENVSISPDETFLELRTNISKDKSTIEDGLSGFFEAEEIEDYKCANCGERTKVEKGYHLQQVPETLIVGINRYTFDQATTQKKKIHTPASLPEVLDLTKWANDDTTANKSTPFTIDDDASAQDSIPDSQPDPTAKHKSSSAKPPFRYKLYAVMSHIGPTALMGHYVAWIRDPRSDVWFQFNDETVTEIGPFDKLGPAQAEFTSEVGMADTEDATSSQSSKGKAAKSDRHRFLDKGAYMVWYIREDVEFPTQLGKVPAAIAEHVTKVNAKLSGEIAAYKSILEEVEKRIDAHKKWYKDVFVKEAQPGKGGKGASEDEDTAYWISSALLKNFLICPPDIAQDDRYSHIEGGVRARKNTSDVAAGLDDDSPGELVLSHVSIGPLKEPKGPIPDPSEEQQALLCEEHMRIDPDNVDTMKRISAKVYHHIRDLFQREVGVSSRHECMICVETRRAADEKARKHKELVAKFTRLAASHDAPEKGEPGGFLIDKSWLTAWKNGKTVGPLNQDLLCDCGAKELRLETKSKRNLPINKSAWECLVSDPTTSKDRVAFTSDTPPCEQCSEAADAAIGAAKELKQRRKALGQTFKNLRAGDYDEWTYHDALRSRAVCYLVPRPLVDALVEYLNPHGDGTLDLDAVPAMFEKLRCVHRKLRVDPLSDDDNLVHYNQATQFVIVPAKTWNAVTEHLLPEGAEKEELACRLTFKELATDLTADSSDEGIPDTVPVLKPEVCEKCNAVAVEEAKVFSDEVVYVQEGDIPRGTRTAPRRTSSRNAPNSRRLAVIVSSDYTVRKLKVEIMQQNDTVTVMPDLQILKYRGQVLDDDTATLQSYGILPHGTLSMSANELGSVQDHILGTMRPGGKETGFAGSALMTGTADAPTETTTAPPPRGPPPAESARPAKEERDGDTDLQSQMSPDLLADSHTVVRNSSRKRGRSVRAIPSSPPQSDSDSPPRQQQQRRRLNMSVPPSSMEESVPPQTQSPQKGSVSEDWAVTHPSVGEDILIAAGEDKGDVTDDNDAIEADRILTERYQPYLMHPRQAKSTSPSLTLVAGGSRHQEPRLIPGDRESAPLPPSPARHGSAAAPAPRTPTTVAPLPSSASKRMSKLKLRKRDHQAAGTAAASCSADEPITKRARRSSSPKHDAVRDAPLPMEVDTDETTVQPLSSDSAKHRAKRRVNKAPTTDTKESLNCRTCGKLLSAKWALKRHESTPHNKVCSECDARFLTRGDLNEHLRQVHNMEPPPTDTKESLNCRTCGKLLSAKWALEKHESTPHNKVCPQCDALFVAQRYLNEHLREVHNMEPPAKGQPRSRSSGGKNDVEIVSTSSKQESSQVITLDDNDDDDLDVPFKDIARRRKRSRSSGKGKKRRRSSKASALSVPASDGVSSSHSVGDESGPMQVNSSKSRGAAALLTQESNVSSTQRRSQRSTRSTGGMSRLFGTELSIPETLSAICIAGGVKPIESDREYTGTHVFTYDLRDYDEGTLDVRLTQEALITCLDHLNDMSLIGETTPGRYALQAELEPILEILNAGEGDT